MKKTELFWFRHGPPRKSRPRRQRKKLRIDSLPDKTCAFRMLEGFRKVERFRKVSDPRPVYPVFEACQATRACARPLWFVELRKGSLALCKSFREACAGVGGAVQAVRMPRNTFSAARGRKLSAQQPLRRFPRSLRSLTPGSQMACAFSGLKRKRRLS